MKEWDLPPHNGKELFQRLFSDWRVTERDGKVFVFRDIQWNNQTAMIRLGLEGAVLFRAHGVWLAMHDFKKTQVCEEWIAGEVGLDHNIYWKPWFAECLDQGREELEGVVRKVGAYYHELIYRAFVKPNLRGE